LLVEFPSSQDMQWLTRRIRALGGERIQLMIILGQ
jgi:hypothetical protein